MWRSRCLTLVSSILHREGVTVRPRGIQPDDLPEVIRLYQAGLWPD